MPTGSLVRQATTKAKRAVLAALAGGVLIASGFLVERYVYNTASDDATARLVEAHTVADRILLVDERLTMSANLAAATGEQRWIDRYNENLPIMNEAIARALELAPPDAVEAFDEATRVANDRLVTMEQRSLGAVAEGNLDRARDVLDSGVYETNKQSLSAGTGALLDRMVSTEQSGLQSINSVSSLLLLLLTAGTLVGIAIMWRLLSKSLDNTAEALLDAEDRVRHLAKSDVLTGLSNRYHFRSSLEAALQRCKSEGGKCAVLAIDLDHFKPVNDKHGHLVGDLVLKEVASRMTAVLGEDAPCSRFGGDEFVAVYEYEGDKAVVQEVADRLVQAINRPIEVENLEVQIGASIGIATFPSDGRNEDSLLGRADVALFSAKRAGRGVAHLYEPPMDADVMEHQRRIEELRTAIENEYIEPYFQPIVDLHTGRTRSLEILARWSHPVRGQVRPDEFIPMAERSGMIDDLTVSVLRSACRAANEFPDEVPIAVNIAPQQIQNRWLGQQILGVLSQTGFPPRRLEIELTENALVSDFTAAKRVIDSLKNLGIRISLDDFGTGYSSLCYLSELSFDKIKIDRSFVKHLGTQSENIKIVSAIISLGNSLGVPIVAEGVETEAQADMLRAMGCTYAQGYLYAKPLPPSDVSGHLLSLDGGVRPAARVGGKASVA